MNTINLPTYYSELEKAEIAFVLADVEKVNQYFVQGGSKQSFKF